MYWQLCYVFYDLRDARKAERASVHTCQPRRVLDLRRLRRSLSARLALAACETAYSALLTALVPSTRPHLLPRPSFDASSAPHTFRRQAPIARIDGLAALRSTPKASSLPSMVLLTVATEDGATFSVDVGLDMELENLMALLEADVSDSNCSLTLREARLTLPDAHSQAFRSTISSSSTTADG